MTRILEPPDDAERIANALELLRPLLALLPPPAAFAVGAAVGALEALLAEPVTDTQDVVTARPVAAHPHDWWPTHAGHWHCTACGAITGALPHDGDCPL